MKKVIVTNLPTEKIPNQYVVTLFNDGRPVLSKTVGGVNNAIMEGSKMAKENNAKYEFKG